MDRVAPPASVTDALFVTQDTFIVFLEWLDGLVVQTKEHGWSEEQARAIVTTMIAGNGYGPPENPEKPE